MWKLRSSIVNCASYQFIVCQFPSHPHYLLCENRDGPCKYFSFGAAMRRPVNRGHRGRKRPWCASLDRLLQGALLFCLQALELCVGGFKSIRLLQWGGFSPGSCWTLWWSVPSSKQFSSSFLWTPLPQVSRCNLSPWRTSPGISSSEHVAT